MQRDDVGRLEAFLAELQKWHAQKIKPYESIEINELPNTQEQYELKKQRYTQFKQHLGFFLRRKNEITRIFSIFLSDKKFVKNQAQLAQQLQQTLSYLEQLEKIEAALGDIINIIGQEQQDVTLNKQQELRQLIQQEQQIKTELSKNITIPTKKQLGFLQKIAVFAAFITALLSTGCKGIAMEEPSNLSPKSEQIFRENLSRNQIEGDLDAIWNDLSDYYKTLITYEEVKKFYLAGIRSIDNMLELKEINANVNTISILKSKGFSESDIRTLLNAADMESILIHVNSGFTNTEVVEICRILKSNTASTFNLIFPTTSLKFQFAKRKTPTTKNELITFSKEFQKYWQQNKEYCKKLDATINGLHFALTCYRAGLSEIKKDLVDFALTLVSRGYYAMVYWNSEFIIEYASRWNYDLRKALHYEEKLNSIKLLPIEILVCAMKKINIENQGVLTSMKILKEAGIVGKDFIDFIEKGKNAAYLVYGQEFGLRTSECLLFAHNYDKLSVNEIRTLANQAKEYLNMTHFYRFKSEDLQKLVENAKNNTGSKALMLLPKSDWNGAFANVEASELYHQILQNYPGMMCYEIETENELYNYIKKTGSKFKINFLIIAGHGSQIKVSFGDADPRLGELEKGEEYSLGFEDKQELIEQKLNEYLSSNAVIWSLSCSTAEGGKNAENLARMLSDVFKSKIYASKSPIPLAEMKLEFTNGELKKLVIRDDENTVFFE